MKRLILILMLAALASCTKEIDFSGTQSDPKLVVNGLQRVGYPVTLQVEKSTFFLNTQPDCRVNDLQIDLFVNGSFQESLTVRDSLIMEEYIIWSEEGDVVKERLDYAFNYCEGSYIPCEGDVLRFEVNSSEFDKAIAEVTMPNAPQVLSFDTTRIETENEYGMTIHFALRINDPAGNTFYNLYPQEALSGFTSTDPVFTELTSVDDIEDIFDENEYYGYGQYNVFNDRFFDGTNYSLSMEVLQYGTEFSEPFTAEVTCIDAGFYQYIKSYRAYSNSDPGSLIGMFTEPVQVYSNVQNAIGVVGAQSQPVVFTLNLTPNS